MYAATSVCGLELLVYEALRGTYAEVATTNISAPHPPPPCVLTTRRSDVTNRCQCDGCSRPFSNRPSTTITVGRPSAHAISQTEDGSTHTATCAPRRRRARCVSALLSTYARDWLKERHTPTSSAQPQVASSAFTSSSRAHALVA